VASQNIYAVDFKNENAQAVEQDPDGNPNEHSHENYISTYVEQSDASVVTDSMILIQIMMVFLIVMKRESYTEIVIGMVWMTGSTYILVQI